MWSKLRDEQIVDKTHAAAVDKRISWKDTYMISFDFTKTMYLLIFITEDQKPCTDAFDCWFGGNLLLWNPYHHHRVNLITSPVQRSFNFTLAHVRRLEQFRTQPTILRWLIVCNTVALTRSTFVENSCCATTVVASFGDTRLLCW